MAQEGLHGAHLLGRQREMLEGLPVVNWDALPRQMHVSQLHHTTLTRQPHLKPLPCPSGYPYPAISGASTPAATTPPPPVTSRTTFTPTHSLHPNPSSPHHLPPNNRNDTNTSNLNSVSTQTLVHHTTSPREWAIVIPPCQQHTLRCSPAHIVTSMLLDMGNEVALSDENRGCVGGLSEIITTSN